MYISTTTEKNPTEKYFNIFQADACYQGYLEYSSFNMYNRTYISKLYWNTFLVPDLLSLFWKTNVSWKLNDLIIQLLFQTKYKNYLNLFVLMTFFSIDTSYIWKDLNSLFDNIPSNQESLLIWQKSFYGRFPESVPGNSFNDISKCRK